jgi:hypothetical protein
LSRQRSKARFAPRPSGTKNSYEIYPESVRDHNQFDAGVAEAEKIVTDALTYHPDPRDDPMQSKATTVEQYLSELPEDRRAAIQAVRKVILENLDSDYEEGIQYGMIGYYVPLRVYPAGYHCDPKQPLPFAGLASQKNHMALYLMCVYGESDLAKWFRQTWAKTGKKLDMGKSCVRFKKLDDLALDVVGEAIGRVPARKYIAYCEAARKTQSEPRAKGSATARAGTKSAKRSKSQASAGKGSRGAK